MTDPYTKQLEEENAKLRQQLIAAQETIDYCGATWKEEINGDEKTYSLCLGNYCLAVIMYIGDEYRCNIIRLEAEKWKWVEMYRKSTLQEAKDRCEFCLGFGKFRVETSVDSNTKHINRHAQKWMIEQVEYQRHTMKMKRSEDMLLQYFIDNVRNSIAP
jgi:hypothetical protein